MSRKHYRDYKARYIEEKELMEWVQNWFEKNRYYHPYSKSNDIPIPELYDILERMPTADVVEVVRCRYCKWRDESTCLIHGAIWKDNDFCSQGKRREDGSEL